MTDPFSSEETSLNDFLEYLQDEPLMESTGLKDTNDREIYEGDVIWYGLNLTGDKYMGSVVFTEGCFQLESPLAEETLPLYGADQLEVIGNIYANPELLQ